MVQRAVKFTPQVLLSAPRRSAGVPNPAGTQVLSTTSIYSFDSHAKTSELRVLDVASGESHLLLKDHTVSDLHWLGDDEFVFLQGEKDGTTSVVVGHVSQLLQRAEIGRSHYYAGHIDAAAANLKVQSLGGQGFAVVVSAPATPSGELYNADKAKKTRSSGRLYTSLFVRHWDRWETPEKDALWFGQLQRVEGKLILSRLTNLLAHTGLESPVKPFGGSDHFDLSADGIIFVSKSRDLNPALNTKCDVFVAAIPSWTNSEQPALRLIEVPGFDGAKSSPVLYGSSAAFLSMKLNGYESDKNRIFVVSDVFSAQYQTSQAITSDDKGWHRSPGSVAFSHDGKSLIITAQDEATTKAYLLSGDLRTAQPQPLTQTGSVADVQPLAGDRLFFSGSTLVDNSLYGLVSWSPDATARTVWTSSNSSEGSKFGLRKSQVSSIWTPASNPAVNREVHSLVVKPSDFEKGRKYPVAYLIHGGPQGAWADSWSTRWNPAVFAEQGYIVVAPNPTGSTGYGQAFTDSIRGNWGGDPYHDIVNVFDWVGKHISEADNDRAVALGASYGGYMMNWIQGHPLGRKFRALVAHDGITTFAGGMYATEELYFPFWELGQPAWFGPTETSPAAVQTLRNFGPTSAAAPAPSPWTQWDPSNHFAHWNTPQLVIHSARDYRLPLGEGLAAFNVLQARGVESQLLTFPDENHWVLQPENALVWHKTVLNWINHYVGLPAFSQDAVDSPEFFGGAVPRKDEKKVLLPSQGDAST